MGFANVGKVWSPEEFRAYLETIEAPSWARAITLHHTGSPTLEDRPNGFLPSHLENMRHYYEEVEVHNAAGTLVKGKWSEGPHLFIDDDQCWGMTDLLTTGVHAGSFNSMAIGIEVLGNYNVENPISGRGRLCWNVAFEVSRALLDWMGLPVDSTTVLFHRDEPNAGKLCPGEKVNKGWVIEEIIKTAAGRYLPPMPPAMRSSAQPF